MESKLPLSEVESILFVQHSWESVKNQRWRKNGWRRNGMDRYPGEGKHVDEDIAMFSSTSVQFVSATYMISTQLMKLNYYVSSISNTLILSSKMADILLWCNINT